MDTFLVTGCDTEIGKTCVVRSLAREWSRTGASVQVVKPVETGVSENGYGDAEFATADLPGVTHHTLRRYRLPMAPLEAARRDGMMLDFDELISETLALPEADVRLVEGAGGIAVPLADDGRDWVNFALALGVCKTVLVIGDRLGAINQARLTGHYAQTHGLSAGFILNAAQPVSSETHQCNLDALHREPLPVWGVLEHGSEAITALRLGIEFSPVAHS